MKPISECPKCNIPLELWVKNKEAVEGGYWRCRKCHVASTRSYRNLSVEARLLSGCKARAKRQCLSFNLTIEDIEVPPICPIFKIPLVTNYTKRSEGTPSIDRIVPNMGYVRGNIVVISWRANRLKNDASLLELSQLHSFYNNLVPTRQP